MVQWYYYNLEKMTSGDKCIGSSLVSEQCQEHAQQSTGIRHHQAQQAYQLSSVFSQSKDVLVTCIDAYHASRTPIYELARCVAEVIDRSLKP